MALNELKLVLKVDGAGNVTGALKDIENATGRLASTTRSGSSVMEASWQKLAGTFAAGNLISMGISAVIRLISSIPGAVMSAINAIDSLKISTIQVAAQITTMQGPNNVAEHYKAATDYAGSLAVKLQEVDANSFANYQTLLQMSQTMTLQGVILDVNNKKQVDSFTALSNAVAMYTAGQNQSIQSHQEIRALMSGEVVQGSMLARQIDEMAKNSGLYKDGLREIVARGKEHGDTLERLAPFLVGINAASGDIGKTWQAVTSSFSTAISMIQRAGFKMIFDEAVQGGGRLVAVLKENAEIIGNRIQQGWLAVRGVLESVGSLLGIFKEPLELVGSLTAMILRGWGLLATAIFPPLFERISEFAKSLWEIVKMVGNLTQMGASAVIGNWEGAADAWVAAKANYKQGGVQVGKAFSDGFTDEIAKRSAEFLALDSVKKASAIPVKAPILPQTSDWDAVLKEAEKSEKLLAVQKSYGDSSSALTKATSAIALDTLTAQHDQGLLSTSDYLNKKYALEKSAIEQSLVAAQAEMAAQEKIYEKLKANKFADPAVVASYEQKYAEAKKAWQLESINLSSLENKSIIERVKLLGEEAERSKKKTLILDQFGLMQQQIDLVNKNGLTEEAFEHQRILDVQKLKFEYSQKMLDYQKQLNDATEAEGVLIRQNMQLYSNLSAAAMDAIQSRSYAASQPSGASEAGSGPSWGWDSNGNIIGGGGSGMGSVTSSYSVQSPSASRADNYASMSQSSTATYDNRRAAVSLLDDLAVRSLMLQGLKDEAELQKLVIAQRNELNQAQEDGLNTIELVNVQQAEYNKLLRSQQLAKATKETETFFATIKKSLADVISTGNTLVTSLRNAATALRQASGDLLTGSNSNLSPEALYAQTRSALANTVSQAMTTGDAALYSQIPSLISAFLEQSKTYNGSGTTYGSDFTWAQNLLDSSATAADLAATNAGAVIDAAQRQQETLDAIKAALTTDNSAALPKLYAEMSSGAGRLNSAVAATNAALASSGAIATGLTGVNNTVAAGDTTAAMWLQGVYLTNESITTATWGVKDKVGAVEVHTYNTRSNLDTTNSHLVGTGGTAGALLNSIDTKTKLIKSVSAVNTYYDSSGRLSVTPQGIITTYAYYANGGIANTASIFGEAGPEAAVPLPDGRSIPVTLSRSDNYSPDLSELIAEVKALRDEVRTQGQAGVRVAQAVGSETIRLNKQQARSSETIANTSRLAVNA